MNKKIHIRLYITAALAFLLALIKYQYHSGKIEPYFFVIELVSLVFFLGVVYIADHIFRSSQQLISEQNNLREEIINKKSDEIAILSSKIKELEIEANLNESEQNEAEVLVYKMFKEELSNDSNKLIGDQILQRISLQYEIILGIFYWNNKKTKQYDVVGTYGLAENANPESFIFGEGLNGQAAKNRSTTLITDIPEEYWTASSCSGEALPKYIYLMPIFNHLECVGLIEIASFKKLHIEKNWQLINDKLIEIIPTNLIA